MRHRTAFTYVELVAVTLVVAIMAAVAMPKYVDAVYYHQANAAAQRLRLDLELARRTAKTNGASLTVEVFTSSSQLRLQYVNDLNRIGDWYRTDFKRPPYNTTITSANFGGDGMVTFSGFGIPDSGGTVVVSSGNQTKTITLDAVTGYASVQQ